MKKKTTKNKILLSMLLPLCKRKDGQFDSKKTTDCQKLVSGIGKFAMGIGTILMLIGFVGVVIKPSAWAKDAIWLWILAIFGTAFVGVGIWLINTSTQLQTYIKNTTEENENEQE